MLVADCECPKQRVTVAKHLRHPGLQAGGDLTPHCLDCTPNSEHFGLLLLSQPLARSVGPAVETLPSLLIKVEEESMRMFSDRLSPLLRSSLDSLPIPDGMSFRLKLGRKPSPH